VVQSAVSFQTRQVGGEDGWRCCFAGTGKSLALVRQNGERQGICFYKTCLGRLFNPLHPSLLEISASAPELIRNLFLSTLTTSKMAVKIDNFRHYLKPPSKGPSQKPRKALPYQMNEITFDVSSSSTYSKTNAASDRANTPKQVAANTKYKWHDLMHRIDEYQAFPGSFPLTRMHFWEDVPNRLQAVSIVLLYPATR
jgi:hypothetical protein